MESCEASAVPFTLLGSLLRGQGQGVPGTCFLRDYAARGTNALLWAGLIWVTVLLIRRLARLARAWVLGSRIPGPPCPSFFGHAKLFRADASRGNLTGYLSEMHEKYGPAVRIWLGPTQLLVSVKDTAMIKEVLIKAEDRLPVTWKAFRLAFGRSSLFISSFEKVQKKRESLARHLNGAWLDRARTIPLKVVERVMGRADSIMSKGILDCRLASQHMGFYILGAALFGDAFLDWPDAILCEELLMRIAKDGCFWASYNIPPFWRRGFWRYQLLCARLRNLTQEIIQQCRNNYDLLGQSDSCSLKETKNVRKEAGLDSTALLDDLKSGDLIWEEIEKLLISKEEPCGNIMGVMFHGSLTIANLIGSILMRLVFYPEIQEKIYSEIVATWKRKCRPVIHEVHEMHFLLATVYESARLLPDGHLLQRCCLKYDLNLKNSLTVPAGAILVVPLQLVQTDSSVWGRDAGQFNPYRFLPKAIYSGGSAGGSECDSVPMASVTGEHKVSKDMLTELNNDTSFLPFGSGTRACIGQKFAILATSTLFASLLQEYEVKLHSGFENDLKPTMDECLFQLLPSPKIAFMRRNN